MQTIKLPRTNAHTFLTHMFGRGLDDDRFRVERFQSRRERVDGEIRPRRCNGPSKKDRGKASREIVSPANRPEDPARARRDHHLHGRPLRHRRCAVLGRICYLGSYVAAMRNPSVLLAVE